MRCCSHLDIVILTGRVKSFRKAFWCRREEMGLIKLKEISEIRNTFKSMGKFEYIRKNLNSEVWVSYGIDENRSQVLTM